MTGMPRNIAIPSKVGLVLMTLLFITCGMFSKSTVPTLALPVALALISGRRVLTVEGLIPLLTWLGLMSISALWSIDPMNSLLRAAQFYGVVLLWWVVRKSSETCQDTERTALLTMLLRAWVVTAVVLLIPALAFLYDPRNVPFPGFVFSHFISKNGAVILTMMSFPVLAFLLRQPLGRVKALALSALLLWAILLAHSSSALLGFSVGVGVWLLQSRWPRFAGHALSVVLPLLVLAMPLLVWDLDPKAITQAVPQFSITFFHRLMIWDFVSHRIVEHPLLGWGFDASRAIPGGTDSFNISFSVPWSDQLFHEKGNTCRCIRIMRLCRSGWNWGAWAPWPRLIYCGERFGIAFFLLKTGHRGLHRHCSQPLPAYRWWLLAWRRLGGCL